MIVINQWVDYPRSIPHLNCYLFTGNKTLCSDGSLVMGAGNAKALKDVCTETPHIFGTMVKNNDQLGLYLTRYGEGLIGAFMVKNHWSQPACLNLIKQSSDELYQHAKHHPHVVYHLPYPAIGKGWLTESNVYPLIKQLPDNVVVYK